MGTDTTLVITLLQSYRDTNYNAIVNDRNTTTINDKDGSDLAVKATSNASMTVYNNSFAVVNTNWFTQGYIDLENFTSLNSGT